VAHGRPLGGAGPQHRLDQPPGLHPGQRAADQPTPAAVVGGVVRQQRDAVPGRDQFLGHREVVDPLDHPRRGAGAQRERAQHVVHRPADLHADPVLPGQLVEAQPAAPGKRVPGWQHHVQRLAQQRHHHPLAAYGLGIDSSRWLTTTSWSAVRASTSAGMRSRSRHCSSTSGVARTRLSSPGSIIRAPDGNIAVRTRPRGTVRSRSTAASARASAASTPSASAASSRPASVSRRPRPAGSVSGSPTSSASARSCCEIADGGERQRRGHRGHRAALGQLAEHPATAAHPCSASKETMKTLSIVFAVHRRTVEIVTTRDRLLACLVAVLWGVNFLAIHVSLEHWPPLLLAALRFLVIAVPAVLLVPRPPVPLHWLLGYGLGFGTLQFLFLYIALQVGMPTGLASLVLQASAPLTVLLGAALLREHLSPRQGTGIGLAVLGLAAIAVARAQTAALLPVLLTLLGRWAGRWGTWPTGSRCATRAARSTRCTWCCGCRWSRRCPCWAASWVVEGPAGVGRGVRRGRHRARAARAARPGLHRPARHPARLGHLDGADAPPPGRRGGAVLAAGAGGRDGRGRCSRWGSGPAPSSWGRDGHRGRGCCWARRGPVRSPRCRRPCSRCPGPEAAPGPGLRVGYPGCPLLWRSRSAGGDGDEADTEPFQRSSVMLPSFPAGRKHRRRSGT
jgi:uncharacterized membrane protein